jgi:hypothetical protein
MTFITNCTNNYLTTCYLQITKINSVRQIIINRQVKMHYFNGLVILKNEVRHGSVQKCIGMATTAGGTTVK